MHNARRDRLAFMLVAVYALGLGACARHAEEPGYGRVYGSLKDDVVITGSSRPTKVAAALAPAAPPARAVQAAAPAVVVTPPAKPAQPSPPAPAPAAASSSISPGPTPAVEQPLPPVDEPTAAAQMLSDGQTLFEAGKVMQARRLFFAAMNGPIPDVMLALARSYDTYYLSRLPTSDAAPDMQRALVLYERALERGAINAAADLERTRAILKIPR
jgi:hypothetical protein